MLPVILTGDDTIVTATGLVDTVTFCGEAPLNGTTPSGDDTVVEKLPVTFNGDGVVTLIGEDPVAIPTETGEPDRTTVGWLVTNELTPATLPTGAAP